MTPMLEQSPALVLFFWALMVPIAVCVLQVSCGICGEDAPVFGRALFTLIIVSLAAYFAFDGSAFLFVVMMQDPQLHTQLPPGYTYWNWMREPLAVKWHVLGLLPLIRYLPIVIGLCVAGAFQVVLLRITSFRIGVMIFILQWVLNVVAMAVLSFVLGVTLDFTGKVLPPQPGASPRVPAPHGPPDSALVQLRQTAEATGKALSPQLRKLKENWDAVRVHADPYLEPIKEGAAPLTSQMPAPVQDFLEGGGWWLVLAVAGGIGLWWIGSTLKRLHRAIFRPRRKQWVTALRENLALIGDAKTEPGPRQITVKGLPARLRLVVMAPAGTDGGDLSPEMADNLLEWIKPGLSEVVSHDCPRVRVWARQYSQGGFDRAFHHHVQVPEAKGRRSHWVLVSGMLALGRQKVHVGLALYAEEKNQIRDVTVSGDGWLDVVSVTSAAANEHHVDVRSTSVRP